MSEIYLVEVKMFLDKQILRFHDMIILILYAAECI